ncbi:MAG TPA: methyltransferase domain-containing protein [Candidatus Baltobacteraceae bacterium]|jgi:SAM-dependent methyltransferase
MDDPVDSLVELEANLRDIERANRRFGGIEPLARIVEATGATEILDVGCGAADIPRSLIESARRQGRTLAITCLDHSQQMLAIAQARNGGVRFVHAEGEALPFEDGSFDIAMCSLTLHHIEAKDAIGFLRELRRVSRMTPIVCDLRRTRLAYAMTWTYANLFTRNRLTRHDAPVSVLRAYTPDEALGLAREAGWRAPRARVEPWFRMTLVDDAR